MLSSNQPSLDDFPEELQLHIINAIKSFDDYLEVRLSSKTWRRIALDSKHFGPLSFFRTHFAFPPKMKHFILKMDSLSFGKVQLGNYYTHSAMQFLASGLPEGDAAILTAACRFGSHYSMQIVNMLNELPGKTKPIVFPQDLIALYKEKSFAVLQATYQKYFPQSEWGQCEHAVKTSIIMAEVQVNTFMTCYVDFYRQQLGVSTRNALEFNTFYTPELTSAVNAASTRLPPYNYSPGFLDKFEQNLFFLFGSTKSLSEIHFRDFWFKPEMKNEKDENEFKILARGQTGKLQNLSFIRAKQSQI